MSNYMKGQIYKLVNDIDDEIYIGSCINLAKRLASHKCAAKTRVNQPVYKHLNAIGWENIRIILIESFQCTSKLELLKRERYWIEKLKPSLNKNVPTRTNKEYQQTKEAKAYQRVYWTTDEGKACQKEYYNNNKDKIIARMKAYNNKEEVKVQRKVYLKAYRDKVKYRKSPIYTYHMNQYYKWAIKGYSAA